MTLRKQTEIERGKALRRQREALGMSRQELARATSYSARQIARWERGDGTVREAVAQYVLHLNDNIRKAVDSDFSFIDLFAGIGGFRRGFESIGGQCVFTSEWDKFAVHTYRENFGGHGLHGDIRSVSSSDIPDHDVLLAGFPCQPFSLAGVSKKNSLGRKHGFECETQGTLFFEIERIIHAKQPRAFVLENVKNLASHDGGRTFDVIVRTLRENLGYQVSTKIIDAGRFVPQHRERVFIVGLHPDLRETFDWSDVKIPALQKSPVLASVLHSEDGTENFEERFLDSDGKVLRKYVLSDHLWEYLQNYALKHKAAGNGFGFGLVGRDSRARTLSARYHKDGSEILVRRGRGNPRRLTPRECARLMGFDQPGKQPFKIPVSDTQAYRQFGNAVVVPVVEAVAKALKRHIVPHALAGEKRKATAKDAA
jgi:DNA (cytosine-5)-methyltransferase 1